MTLACSISQDCIVGVAKLHERVLVRSARIVPNIPNSVGKQRCKLGRGSRLDKQTPAAIVLGRRKRDT